MNDAQLLRYSRHILLHELDVQGQQTLLTSTVLIVGAGGLGCPAALYLAASGIGHVIIVDDDTVELSNLQRQIAHDTEDLGNNKAISLQQSIKALNADCDVTALSQRLTVENGEQWIQQADIVLDCSDNFTTRFLLNRLCFAFKKPLVSGAAIRFEGQVAVFDFRQSQSPCYACLYDENVTTEQSCSHNGVLSPLVGIIGSYQAALALQSLCGIGQNISGYLQQLDLTSNHWRRLKITKDAHCPVCGLNAHQPPKKSFCA